MENLFFFVNEIQVQILCTLRIDTILCNFDAQIKNEKNKNNTIKSMARLLQLNWMHFVDWYYFLLHPNDRDKIMWFANSHRNGGFEKLEYVGCRATYFIILCYTHHAFKFFKLFFLWTLMIRTIYSLISTKLFFWSLASRRNKMNNKCVIRIQFRLFVLILEVRVFFSW